MRRRQSITTEWFEGIRPSINHRTNVFRKTTYRLGGPLRCGILVLLSLLSFSTAAQEVNFPHPIIKEKARSAGETPPGEVQDDADIRRTSEAAFGHSLSEQQVQKIRSWNPTSLDWWLDEAREVEAQQLLPAIYAATGQAPDARTLKSQLAVSDSLFGLDVLVDKGSDSIPGPTEATAIEVSFDPHKRPDLASYNRLLFSVAEDYIEKSDAAGRPYRTLFYLLFPPSLTGVEEIPGPNTLTPQAFLDEARAMMAIFDTELETKRVAMYEPVLTSVAITDVIDLQTFEELQMAGERARCEAVRIAIDTFLAALDEYEYHDQGRNSKVLLTGAIEHLLPSVRIRWVMPTPQQRQQSTDSLFVSVNQATGAGQ